MTRSLTSAVTILPKAPPMTTATARSTTLPRLMKSLNSLRSAIALSFPSLWVVVVRTTSTARVIPRSSHADANCSPRRDRWEVEHADGERGQVGRCRACAAAAPIPQELHVAIGTAHVSRLAGSSIAGNGGAAL